MAIFTHNTEQKKDPICKMPGNSSGKFSEG